MTNLLWFAFVLPVTIERFWLARNSYVIESIAYLIATIIQKAVLRLVSLSKALSTSVPGSAYCLM